MNQNENNAMSLSDLRDAWVELDQRVEVDFARMETMTTALVADRAQSLVRQAVWLPIIELVATLAGLSLVILGLMQDGSPVFFSCLISILVLFGLLIASAVFQIAWIATVDHAAPVVATQRRLGRVRALRIFENKWMMMLSPVLWAPFLVVIVELFVKVVIGNEASVFSAGFVLANLIIGALVSLGLVGASHWFADRLAGSSFLSDLLDEFAGRRLTAAREFLDRLDGFENE